VVSKILVDKVDCSEDNTVAGEKRVFGDKNCGAYG